jgi:hypothetical protein
MRKDQSINPLPAAWVAFIIYLLLSLIFFGATGNYSLMYVGSGDAPIFIWCLNWWPWAITHGLNPFITYHVWYPHGFNMTWVTSMPCAALLASPITLLANAVVSFNVLSLLAPALSAWTGFLLAQYITRDPSSSFIAGYLFGFSSYELGEMLGHLHLNMTFVVPLLVLLVVQRIRGDLSRRRFVVTLAAGLLLQLGLATEILATVCVFGAITWFIFFAFAPPEERGRLWMVSGEIIVAVVVMAALGAPFLFFALKDLGDIPQLNSPQFFSVDPLNIFIPTELTRVGGTVFAGLVQRFHLFEHGAYGSYLGLPVVLILILQLLNIRQRSCLEPLYLSLLVMIVLSLGPTLRVAGVDTNVWLPWSLSLQLPLIHQALPSRFFMYVEMAAALAVALWLSAAKHGWDRAGRFALAALACVSLLPNPTMFRWTPLPLVPFFEPNNVDTSLGHNANVIVLPFGNCCGRPSLIWQWQSGMRFTQSGGNLCYPPESESAWPVVHALDAGLAGPGFADDLTGFCFTHRVSAILVGPGTPTPLAAAIEDLHWQETKDHGITVVRVPYSSVLHFYYVLGDYWPEGPESWMGHQINIVTHGQPMQLTITGQYRPPELGPVEISVVNGSDVSRYRIAEHDQQVLNLPADASVILTASGTFVPARISHSGDERSLSVRIRLQRCTF